MVKESFKKLSFAKKENSLHVFEKRRFFARLQRPLARYHEPKSIKTFYKKDSLAHYLSYATLMTYVPVLGAEQF